MARNNIIKTDGSLNYDYLGQMDDKIGILNKRADWISVEEFGVKGDGVTDDRVNFQNAINQATVMKKKLYIPAKTYLLSSTPPFNDSCLKIPSNATLYFEPGAVLRIVDNAPAWARVLVISGVTNVKIYGHVEIDGRCTTVTNGNEHMHGIFIYNSKDIFIESAYVHDCYGDNLFVGGWETTPSENVKINYFRGVKAGRKNLVIHYVDKLHIGTAILDNSQGGAPNWTGSNSLDLEPDDFTGSREFYQRIDYLSTIGKGNDFTVGISENSSEKWILDIGTFDCRVTGTTGDALTIYALTLRVSNFILTSKDGKTGGGVFGLYGPVIEIGTGYIENINGPAFNVNAAGGWRPKVRIGNLKISGKNLKNSAGVRIQGVDLYIGNYDCRNISSYILYSHATASDHQITIENVVSRNCGSGQLFFLSSFLDSKPDVHINNIAVFDDRATKVARIIEFATSNAMLGTTIGTIHNPYGIPEWATTYGNFKRRLKLAGGTVLPAVYIVDGSPEGILDAPVGSIAMRINGGAGTCLYVKESGTGNTGWVAK